LSRRFANLARIRTLDPERDYVAIFQMMALQEFPWDLKLGLNLAFMRSFSMPSVAAVLAATGELLGHTEKRLDDTGLLIYEILLNGFDQERGRAALRRINQIHRPHDIPDEDYLYVLGCLVVIPIRWLEVHGWRRPCCHERQASYLFFRELGRRMNITCIPASFEAFEAWFDSYDAAHLLPNDDAAAIERATRMRMLARIPRLLAPLSHALVSAMYDERLRRAIKVGRPGWPVRAGLNLGLKTRARLLRWFGTPRRRMTTPAVPGEVPRGRCGVGLPQPSARSAGPNGSQTRIVDGPRLAHLWYGTSTSSTGRAGPGGTGST
jgi:mpaB/rubber oxygenase-like protein